MGGYGLQLQVRGGTLATRKNTKISNIKNQINTVNHDIFIVK